MNINLNKVNTLPPVILKILEERSLTHGLGALFYRDISTSTSNTHLCNSELAEYCLNTRKGVVARGRFELPSTGPKPAMPRRKRSFVRYTTGLFLSNCWQTAISMLRGCFSSLLPLIQGTTNLVLRRLVGPSNVQNQGLLHVSSSLG